jgi:hypothetical protein
MRRAANWSYGAEDVLGDGPNFTPAEQAIDIRTAYATTDCLSLAARNVRCERRRLHATVYVTHSDRNAATGGGISA